MLTVGKTAQWMWLIIVIVMFEIHRLFNQLASPLLISRSLLLLTGQFSTLNLDITDTFFGDKKNKIFAATTILILCGTKRIALDNSNIPLSIL